MFLKPSNRWQAFGIHIAISLLLFLVLAAVIYFLWYPGFLFRYDGGLEGMKLIAGVDFFIGPLLTLCVYKLGKKSLRFDLVCIALLQLACLTGGMWTVWKTRPIAVVYAGGTFATTNWHGYEAQGMRPDRIEILQTAHWPVWLAVNQPEGAESAIAAVWAMMGTGMEYNAENYVPLAQNLDKLGKTGLASGAIKDAKDSAALHALESNSPEIKFYPMNTSLYAGYLAVNSKTGAVLEFFEQK